MIYGMAALWLAMGFCWFFPLAAAIRKSRVYLVRMVGDLCGASIGVLAIAGDYGGGFLSFLIGALLAVFDYHQYRKHRDDDDDWGKRLKSWARSHIPRPTIVQLRPQAGEA